MLMYDDKVEEADNSFDGKTTVYRLNPVSRMPLLAENVMRKLPCASCPVVDQCAPGGYISPTNCIFFQDW